MWYGDNYELAHAVEAALGLKLTDQEKMVLHYRLGWNEDSTFLTQQEMADRVKLSQPYVSNIERGLKERLRKSAEARQ
jgi:DNA-directed RNA polymerase specialized sigma subunit